MALKVRVIAPHELSQADRQRWLAILDAQPAFGSPYLHPAFTRAVGLVCPNARVAVLEEDRGIVGFLPFQRSRLGLGQPIGGQLCDQQAIVARDEVRFDARDLVRRMGLVSWRFHHLLAAQAPFSRFHRNIEPSPTLDLAGGYQSYLQRRRAMGGERLSQLARKARKLERELGPVRFDADARDHDLVDWVIRGKSDQCRRTGVFDFFARVPWTVPLVRRLRETREDGFAGMLSVLWVGDRVAAAHLGMRTERCVHWWFPTYRPDDDTLARYSPGQQLLLALAERAASTGATCLDLGKGDDAYKTSFATGSYAVAEGEVDTFSVTALARRVHAGSRVWLKTAPLLAPARRMYRTWKGTPVDEQV
jgi:CelD/BcsL family acetyltransferase involved in cellulose biosynthesis